MSDIAIAFSIVDADMSEKIALAVEDYGLKVLRAPLTPTALDKALVVVAIWSATSVRSAVVNDVARQAAEAGKLISVNVGAPEILERYTTDGAHDLACWNGISRGPAVEDFLRAVSTLAQGRRFAREAETVRPPVVRELSLSTATRLASEGVTASGILVRSPPAPDAAQSPSDRERAGAEPRRPGARSVRQPAAAPADRRGGGEAILFEPQHDYLVREAAFWVGIRDSAIAADYLRYLESFGEEGVFADLARYRLRLLRTDQTDDTPKSSKRSQDRRRARSGGVSRMGFGAIGVTVVAAAAVLHFAKPVLPTFVPPAAAHVSVAQPAPAPPVEARDTRTDPGLALPSPTMTAAAAPEAPLVSSDTIRAAPMETHKPVSVVSVRKESPKEIASVRRAYTSTVSEAPRPMDLAAVDLAPVALDTELAPIDAPSAFSETPTLIASSHAERSAASAALAIAELEIKLSALQSIEPLTPIPELPSEKRSPRMSSLRPIEQPIPID